jgi:uncharacterized membrane protein
MPVRRQNKRDAIIIKRIGVVMIVLLLLGIPSCLFVIGFIINGYLHWAAYRVGWMTISISFALISLSSVYVTPQIYEPIRLILNHPKTSQRNRSSSTSTYNNVEIQRKTERFLFKRNVTTSTV